MDYIKALKKLVPEKAGLETFTDEKFSEFSDSLKSHEDKNVDYVPRLKSFNAYRYIVTE